MIIKTDRSENSNRLLLYLTAAGQAVLLLLCFWLPASAAPAEKKEWTVMIYMVGSNLESLMGSASEDIFELEDADIDFQKNNVVLCTGGAMRWMTDIPCDRNCIVDLSLNEKKRIVSSTEESENMGKPETLASFVNFCHEHYPAKKNMLILWDHGGGPVHGFGSDEIFESDPLSLPELEKAMKMTPCGGDNKLDLIGFDACLMGSLECMTVFSDYADYFIGSEELEPGGGWDYRALSVLNQGSPGAAEVAEAIIDGYGALYEKKKGENSGVTLSLADLSKTGQANDCLGRLASAVSENLGVTEYASLQRERRSSKSFGYPVSADRADGTSVYDIVDLKDLAGHLSESYPAEAEALIRSVEELILYQTAGPDGAGGVSVYFPSDNKGQYRQSFESYRKISRVPEYCELLERIGDSWQYEKSRGWTLQDPENDGEELLLQLTDEQLSVLTKATYTVFLEEDESYLVLKALCGAEPDEDGVLHVPADPYVLCYGEEDKPYIGSMFRQTEDGYGDEYTARNLALSGTLFGYNDRYASFADEVKWIAPRVYLDEDTGETEILSVTSDPEFDPEPGKSSIDLSEYEAWVQFEPPLAPTRDDEGSLLPFQEWESTHVNNIGIHGLENGLSVSAKKASEVRGTCIQIEIEDVNGERYASELIPVEPDEDHRILEENTKEGTLTFSVYEDHAELTGYHGDDTKLELPESVGGVPLTVIGSGVFGSMDYFLGSSEYSLEEILLPDTVTEICDNAFYNVYNMQTLKLPAGLRSIGEGAFAYCSGLTGLEIPDGVTDIGSGAFAYCRRMKKLTLPSGLQHLGKGVTIWCRDLEEIVFSGNRRYILSDGAVYSVADNELLAYTCGRKEKEIAVREGTLKIGYGAFFGAEGVTVSFPDTLEEIGNYAFEDCVGLRVLNWPKDLKRVGERAFGVGDFVYEAIDDSFETVRIEIGPDLSKIGKGAFDLFPVKSFSADEDNRFFTAKDGHLMNKAGDAVEQFATRKERYLSIPEGTVRLSWENLGFIQSYFGHIGSSNLFHIRVPDSVIRFPEEAYPGVTKIMLHCSPGSAAEKYAEEHGILHTNEPEVEYTLWKEKSDAGTAWYYLFADHAELVGLNCSGESFAIPETVQGLPVTAVGSGDRTLSSFAKENGEEDPWVEGQILIPDTVKEIRDGAFRYAGTSASLELPDSLVRIGSEALGAASIGDGVFTIHKDLSYIATDASAILKEYRIEGENDVYSVRDGMLYSKDGSRLIACPAKKDGNVSVPGGTRVIGAKAFASKSDLRSVVLPDSVQVIGASAFEDCYYLENVKHGSGIREIQDKAFFYCKKMKGFVFNDGLVSIGEKAFYNVPFEGELHFPESLKTIGAGAFMQYSSFEEERQTWSEISIYIGKNVYRIGDGAFEGRRIREYTVSDENICFEMCFFEKGFFEIVKD